MTAPKMIKALILVLFLGYLSTAYIIAEQQAEFDEVSIAGVKSTTYKTTITHLSEDDPILKSLPPPDGQPHVTKKVVEVPGGGTKTITTTITLTKISVTAPTTTEAAAKTTIEGVATTTSGGETTTTSITTTAIATGTETLGGAGTPEIQPVFRWWSQKDLDHFYCLDPKGEIASQVGYTYEGIEFCTLKTQVEGSLPLYRLYGGKSNHFYTTDADEAKKSGYAAEGNIGYIFPKSTTLTVKDENGNILNDQKTIPLYRWHQADWGDHFYFVDPTAEKLRSNNYQDDGIAGYVFACKQPKVEPQVAEEPKPINIKETDLQKVYRWWSQKDTDHFYCLDPKGEIAPQVGYTYEGVEFCTLKTQIGNSTAFLRLYGGKADHFYTTDSVEAKTSGYAPEGDLGYVFTAETTVQVLDDNGRFVKNLKVIPLYRWYQASFGDHFYFVDPTDEKHKENNYKDEGIAAYVFPCKEKPTAPEAPATSAASAAPAALEASAAPIASTSPTALEASAAPVASATPAALEASAAPVASTAPAASAAPVTSASPAPSAALEASAAPVTSAAPAASTAPPASTAPVASASPAPSAAPAAPDNRPSVKESDIQSVYRWWSAKAADHFYCLDPKGEIAPQSGYVYEGIEFCTFKTRVGSATQLFRLWNGMSSDHFYTTDAVEARKASGYTREGDIGYIFPSATSVKVLDASGTLIKAETLVPLYRYYNSNSGDHFYCVDPSVEKLTSYKSEGITGYVYPCKSK